MNDKAKEIIEKVIYITLATVDKSGQPWNTPLFSAYDKDYNFYWGSSRISQHSKNIASNNKVFIVVYDSTIPAGRGEGVYIKAEASELNDPTETRKAHKYLQDRRPEPYWELKHFLNRTSISLYKAVPEKIWMNDNQRLNDIYEDIRNEIKLS